jgi:hypothetical protein
MMFQVALKDWSLGRKCVPSDLAILKYCGQAALDNGEPLGTLSKDQEWGVCKH